MVPKKPDNAGEDAASLLGASDEAKDAEIGVSLQTPDSVRRLQKTLYVKAKNEPAYRFYLLYDKVCRADISTRYRVSRAARGARTPAWTG